MVARLRLHAHATPLAGLFVRAKGGFYHDGRFADYRAVVFRRRRKQIPVDPAEVERSQKKIGKSHAFM